MAKLQPRSIQASSDTRSDTYCVRFWNALDVTREGLVRPCCAFQDWVSEDSKPVLFSEATFDQVVGSTTMVNWREQALQGQAISGCQQCYTKERSGSVSDRILYNREYALRHGQDPRTVFDQAVFDHGSPQVLSLHLGNQCNLKCRMCGPQASSSIAADGTHRDWAARGFGFNGGLGYKGDFNPSWIKNPQLLIDRVAPLAPTLEYLMVSGGEPLIMPLTRHLFRYLIESGHASHIRVSMASNGTRVDDGVLEQLSQFQQVHPRLSVDGYGQADEYVRYPSQWDEVETNLKRLQALPNVRLSAGFTLSAYNIFEPVKVVQWAMAQNLAFEYGFVDNPYYLNAAILPSGVLQAAADRIFRALDTEFSPTSAWAASQWRAVDQLRGLGEHLQRLAQDAAPQPVDEFYEFMAFTNDLDRDRQQTLATACPDLWQAIHRHGYGWTDGRGPGFYAARWRRFSRVRPFRLFRQRVQQRLKAWVLGQVHGGSQRVRRSTYQPRQRLKQALPFLVPIKRGIGRWLLRPKA